MPDASKSVQSAATTDGQGGTARQVYDAAFVPMSEPSAERTRPPAELNSLEIVAALGAVLVAVGAFLPAASSGWLIRCPREPVNAMLLAVLGVGFPLAVVRALGGETDDLFGLRPAEDRMLTWMTLAMLAWGWLLSLIPPRP